MKGFWLTGLGCLALVTPAVAGPAAVAVPGLGHEPALAQYRRYDPEEEYRPRYREPERDRYRPRYDRDDERGYRERGRDREIRGRQRYDNDDD